VQRTLAAEAPHPVTLPARRESADATALAQGPTVAVPLPITAHQRQSCRAEQGTANDAAMQAALGSRYLWASAMIDHLCKNPGPPP